MYKSRLQELCHQRSWSLPTYTSSKGGPDHCPTFTATVSVNGIDFPIPCPAKSTKEAQNEAAKIAFDYFTTPLAPLPSSLSPMEILSLADSSTGILSITANETGTCQLTNEEKLANSGVHKNESKSSDDIELKGMYKNQLQYLAQKRNLSIPVYDSIRDGQPHAPRFKATVTVDGQTFESPDLFSTLREAEHAAAKIALASLSDGIQEVDAGVYKNLLQELAQKEGFSLPVYSTITSGPSHLPTFFSTVEVEGEIFSGEAAKSRKRAEMLAAKVAWCSLEERKLSKMFDTLWCPISHHEAPHHPGLSLERISDEIQQNVSANIDPSSNKPSTSTSHLVFPPKTQMEELSFSTRPLLQSKEPSSLSEIRYLHLQDYFTAEALFPEAEKSSAHLDCSESSLADSSGVQGSSSRVLLGNRIRVYPHGANIQLPEGITRLPISDNEWVAVEVEGCRSPLYH